MAAPFSISAALRLSSQKRERARVLGHFEQKIPFPGKGLDLLILLLISSNDEPCLRRKPEMSSHLQEMNIVERKVGMMSQQIPHPRGKSGIRQKAPSCRTGIVMDAEKGRHLDLRFSRPSLEAQQFFPIHPPFFFRQGTAEAVLRREASG